MEAEVDVVVTVLVAVVVLLMCFSFYLDFESYQEQTKQVAECSCIGVDMNSSGRIYKCPDGVLYTVNSTIRNAKGE
jgi:hypothetical protein